MKALHNREAKYLPLFQGFTSLVGKELAKNVFIRDIKNNFLYVDVVHPGWAQALLLKKESLLKRINSIYQELNIKDIKIGILKQPVLLNNSEKKRLEPESVVRGFDLEELLNQMPENDLKQALKRIYQAKLKSRR